VDWIWTGGLGLCGLNKLSVVLGPFLLPRPDFLKQDDPNDGNPPP
jgi:hypothetical protein